MSRSEDIFANLPSLDTARLLLRRLTLEDADDVYAYASDPLVARYTSWEPHNTIADSRSFLERVMAVYERHEVYPWGIFPKADRKLIGTCGYMIWTVTDAKAEIGYAMHCGYWGQGLMSEAVAAVIQFGFGLMKLNRIEAFCLPENSASWRVMEKVGMQREGRLREWIFSKGAYRDILMYSILRREWVG